MVDAQQPEPPGSLTLAALLARVARRDEAAFEELYTRTSPKIHGMALRIVRDPGLAEEVTLDAFTHVWRRAADYTPERGSVLAWLVILVRSRALDRVRSGRSRSLEVGPEVLMDLPDPQADPSQVAEGRDGQRRLLEALLRVSEKQREVLHAAFLGGLTHREIANQFDMPLGTVKRRIRDGLNRLREVLGAVKGAENREEWA